MSESVTAPPPPGAPCTHPVSAALTAIESALTDVAETDPIFMATPDKAAALLAATREIERLRELQLRLLACSDDVAAAEGMRDPAAWLAHHARLEPGECRRLQRLAQSLADPHADVREALRDGQVNAAQAAVITEAVDALPARIGAQVREKARGHLLEEARKFGPRSLRILGRRILDIVAPEIAEEEEGRQLDEEEREARRRTFLRFRNNGDGTTDIHGRVADSVAARFKTYLESFSSPRRDHLRDEAAQSASKSKSESASESASGSPSTSHPQPAPRPAPDDRRPYDQRMGHAFGAFLESVDPARLPVHGGDATTIMVTIDFETLKDELGVAMLDDMPISAADARRMACMANILPVVLGGKSEVLDLGRSARLAKPSQRRAATIRDGTCRGEGCDIPAAWCEMHHLTPWATGGATDLDDLALLCSFHHHRAHDHRYRVEVLPDGQIRFCKVG